MIIAIDPDTKQHACAMGELRNGQPHCSRVWTIQRMGKNDALHNNYLEGLLDLVQTARGCSATIICEDAYLGENVTTFKRLVEARHEITHRAWEFRVQTLPHVLLSVWATGLGIPMSIGRVQITARYEIFAARWATATGWTHQLSEHESAAMGILWWALTTGGAKPKIKKGKINVTSQQQRIHRPLDGRVS